MIKIKYGLKTPREKLVGFIYESLSAIWLVVKFVIAAYLFVIFAQLVALGGETCVFLWGCA